MFKYLHQKLSAFATSVGERILITPNNQISMGMLHYATLFNSI